MNKGAKPKPRYSMGSDIHFLLRVAWENFRPIYFWSVLAVILQTAAPFLAMLLPSRIIALLGQGVRFERLCAEVLLLALGVMACGTGRALAEEHIDSRHLIRPREILSLMSDQKLLTTDYPNGEDQAFLTAAGKKGEVINNNGDAGEETYRTLRRLLGACLGLAAYGAVLWGLSPWLMAGVGALTCLGFFTRRGASGWVFRNRDNWTPLERKMRYIDREAGDYRYAKDVRLFGMSRWLLDLYQSFFRLRLGWASKQGWVEFAADAADALITFLREGGAYAWLLSGAVAGSVDAAAFVLYFGAVGNFSGQLMACLQEFSILYTEHLQLAAFREFLDWPERFRREGGRPLPKKQDHELILKDVSFRYPGAEADSVHHVSLTLRTGEKTALVGLNGAGKSTLVKLLCGLYDPTEGQVLLDGIPITEFNREEYYTLFSAVFQESGARAYSLEENVALSDKPDRQRVIDCLELAGLREKAESLPKGLDTKLMKYIWHEGVDLSGGEVQKLMLARALYKDGPIILLDEPTAALDPIAEAELYEKYSGLTAGKASLYISHRLSSTRFCDRVLFLEHGEIVEEGSHRELLEKRGKYYELYEIQSAYYRGNPTGEEGGLGYEEVEPV